MIRIVCICVVPDSTSTRFANHSNNNNNSGKILRGLPASVAAITMATYNVKTIDANDDVYPKQPRSDSC